MNTTNYEPYIEEVPLGATTSMSVQPSYPPSFSQKENPPPSVLDSILLVILSLVFSSSIAIVIGGLTWAYRRKIGEKQFFPQQVRRNYCQGCQYLHPNTSLKCAVHPGTVMTENSADCRDYLPKQSK